MLEEKKPSCFDKQFTNNTPETGCPDYIVVFDGQAEGSYCKSYGKQVCGWVFKNYNKEKEIGKSERVFVMRKK